MAKEVYKIPADLNQNYLDMELAIQSKDGLGVRPLPIKVILSWIISAMLCFCICTKTFVQYGGFFLIVAFVALWFALSYFLLKTDSTKRMAIQDVISFLAYMPSSARKLMTRMTSEAAVFYRLLNIDKINNETGLITFNDGTFGYCMSVVGTASVLLFDDDRNAILNRVDNFYRKIGTDVEIIYITSKESQKITHQVANLKRRFDNLNNNDPDLRACAEEQFSTLKNYVGGQFKSIHQYLIIKADNKEVLTVAKNAIKSESENSSLMFKKLVWMIGKDEKELIRSIVSGRELD